VRVLAASAELTAIAGDPNQAVFSYRGADPALLHGDEDDPVITLTQSYRCAPAVAHAITGIARRLPGAGPARELVGTGAGSGSVSVRVAASPHAESALVVDALRRAHLIDEVPWSQMAVIVRSVRQSGAALSRALTAAGVPVVVPPSGVPLAEQPAARAMLTVLAATADGLDGDRALDLLTGPIGLVDPVSLRQLRRALRRADRSQPRDFETCSSTLESNTVEVSGGLARPARRVRAVLAEPHSTQRDDGTHPRYTLW
jgi:superfamily I DNA/RNA helicase